MITRLFLQYCLNLDNRTAYEYNWVFPFIRVGRKIIQSIMPANGNMTFTQEQAPVRMSSNISHFFPACACKRTTDTQTVAVIFITEYLADTLVKWIDYTAISRKIINNMCFHDNIWFIKWHLGVYKTSICHQDLGLLKVCNGKDSDGNNCIWKPYAIREPIFLNDQCMSKRPINKVK